MPRRSMRICTALLALSLGAPAALLLASAAPQKRVSQEKKEPTFAEHLQAAGTAHDGQRWGQCSESLQAALSIALRERRSAVLASLPSPGEGWELEQRDVDDAEALYTSALMGFMVEARFKGPEGARLTTTITLGSPMAQMLAMQLSNPKLMGENAEPIEYEKHKALLIKQGEDRHQLQILMGDDVVQVETRGISDDRLLEIYSEAALGAVESAATR